MSVANQLDKGREVWYHIDILKIVYMFKERNGSG